MDRIELDSLARSLAALPHHAVISRARAVELVAELQNLERRHQALRAKLQAALDTDGHDTGGAATYVRPEPTEGE